MRPDSEFDECGIHRLRCQKLSAPMCTECDEEHRIIGKDARESRWKFWIIIHRTSNCSRRVVGGAIAAHRCSRRPVGGAENRALAHHRSLNQEVIATLQAVTATTYPPGHPGDGPQSLERCG